MANHKHVEIVKNRKTLVINGESEDSFNLQKADFRNSDLHQMKFSKCDLSGSNFYKSQLWRVEMDECKLEDANLEECNLDGANLIRSNLRSANLRLANLADSRLNCVNLTGAILKGANLSRSSLRGANLKETNLQGARLQQANLSGANLDNADLRRADLRDADLFYASLRNVDIRGANFEGVDTRAAKIITFRQPPEKLFPCPQDMFQSVCVKCNQEARGRYFGFHYGFEKATERYGGGGYGSVTETVHRYKILGYYKAFLCERCVWRRLRNGKILGPLIPLLIGLVCIAVIAVTVIISPLGWDKPGTTGDLFLFLGSALTLPGIGFFLPGILEVTAFYSSNARYPVEDFAKSLCKRKLANELRKEYPREYDDLPICMFNSSEYLGLN